MSFRVIKGLMATAGLAFSLAAQSAAGDPVIPALFRDAAEMQGIPPSLFYAIGMQESGRIDPEAKVLQPWPWALNVGGEARYFESMEEAWTALGDAFAEVPRNIDIGLVQVSWPVNRHIINDPYMALDPATNLALGAQILRECFDRLGDWWKAVGCYHSPTPERAAAYSARVRRHLRSLGELGEASS